MSKKDKSQDNNQFYIESGIDIEKRRIDISEDIDEFSIGWALRGLQIMEDRSSKPIDIFISSYGGSVYDGFGFYSKLKRTKCLVRTHAVGKIMSMAFLIYLVGDERYSEEYTTFLNHSISSMSWGKLHEMQTEVKECERLEEVALGILADRTNKDKKWWKKQSKYEDKYYNKDKAVELGITTHEY